MVLGGCGLSMTEGVDKYQSAISSKGFSAQSSKVLDKITWLRSSYT